MIPNGSGQQDAFYDPEDWHNFSLFLRDESRFVLSDYWDTFIGNVVFTSKNRTQTLEKGTKLVRARIGTRLFTLEDGNEQPSPLFPEEMWDIGVRSCNQA